MTEAEEVPAAPVESSATAVDYYNLSGHHSKRPLDGINIEVTTHSDNSRSAKKILRVQP